MRSVVSRGFTDHEQLDDFGLVHMNGRIYDPGIGRFLSAAPFLQAPMVTQNFNRYSYVVNNPLSLSDPTGFNIFENFFNWMNKHVGSTWTQVIIGAASVVAGVVTAGAGLGIYASYAGITLAQAAAGVFAGSLTSAVVAGAGFGFGSAFTSTLLSGASIGQAFANGAIAGVAGAVTAWAGGTILHPMPFAGPTEIAEKSFGHALLGGAFAAAENGLQSGKAARDGFIGAFMAELLTGGMAPGGNFGEIALHAVAAGVVGGTAAVISGGKFANGAITAAFLRLFNEEARDLAGRLMPDQAGYAPGEPYMATREFRNEAQWTQNGKIVSYAECSITIRDREGYPVRRGIEVSGTEVSLATKDIGTSREQRKWRWWTDENGSLGVDRWKQSFRSQNGFDTIKQTLTVRGRTLQWTATQTPDGVHGSRGYKSDYFW